MSSTQPRCLSRVGVPVTTPLFHFQSHSLRQASHRPRQLRPHAAKSRGSVSELSGDEFEEVQVADLETILEEKGACGVGFIASLKNERTHDTVSKVDFSLILTLFLKFLSLGVEGVGMHGASWSVFGRCDLW